MADFYVENGITAASNSYGYVDSVFICSGGRVLSATLSGDMYLLDGGKASRTTVKHPGKIYIESGGYANSTTVYTAGGFYLMPGGSTDHLTLQGYMIQSGGNAGTVMITGDGELTVSDGIVRNAVVGSSGAAGWERPEIRMQGGIIEEVRVDAEGILTISKTASASGVDIASGGMMDVCDGGIVNHVSVESGGKLFIAGDICDLSVHGSASVANGGTVNTAVVESGGNLSLKNSFIRDLSVKSGGTLDVSSGGSASGITVCSGGMVHILDGGFAENIAASSGGFSESGGSVFIASGGSIFIASGGSAKNLTLNFSSYLDVQGRVESVTANLGAVVNGFFLFEERYFDVITSDGLGGYIKSAWVQGAEANLNSDGRADDIKVGGRGKLYVSGGAIVSNVNLSYSGSMTVLSGAVVSNVDFSSGGTLIVSSGGSVANIDWTPGQGHVEVSEGANVSFTSKYSGCYLGSDNHLISSAAMVSVTKISGTLYVMSGGSAWRTSVDYGGSAWIYNDGIMESSTISSGGMVHVYDGGRAKSTMVNRGTLHIAYGGEANGVILSRGDLYVDSGGFANNIGVNSYCTAYVNSGGFLNSVYITHDGRVILTGGIMQNANLSGIYTAGGWWLSAFVLCQSSGLVDNALINFGGKLNLGTGGTAKNTVVNMGTAIIENGGTASCTEVLSGGTLIISGGGVHKGKLGLQTGATVSVDSGGIIDFTVAERNVSDDYLINHLSLITGTPDYTITVKSDQSAGTYKLAQGAGDFSGTVSIRSENVVFGSLTVNGDSLEYNGTGYSLVKDGENLTLIVADMPVPSNLKGDPCGLQWDAVPDRKDYVVQYSADNFVNAVSIQTQTNSLDFYAMPSGTYQWRVKISDGPFVIGETFIASGSVSPQSLISDADGNTDVFFAGSNGVWTDEYQAQHTGVLNGWTGTGEQADLSGKNRLSDLFQGSSDANVLLMTDDINGDVLFLDDIYTAFPGDAVEQMARVAQIHEIRAGAGDDIVDMTSQRFVYDGSGIVIYGGSGNDTIWANNGNHTLYGDAGDDRIVGGNHNDFIIGGIGNDSLHGGGGNDIFCFGENWGSDTVEQCSGGSITLWFERENGTWNEETRTYRDGSNTVIVSGDSEVTILFGTDITLPPGAFANAVSEKIFENHDKRMLV